MAHRISTKQSGVLNHLDQIAMNQSNYGNVYGGSVGGFGIIKGCELASQGTGNVLRIAKGRLMISGALVEIEQTDINLGTNTIVENYSVIAKINLKEDTISVRTQKDPYTAKMVDLYEQPDADSELLIGTFTFDKGVIKNIIQEKGMTVVKENPVGSLTQYAGATAPIGWLLCQGQAISRTSYAKLYAVLSTTYGIGDGSTTFNLPNLSGRVPVGKSSDAEFNALGKLSGAKTHTLTVNEMPNHAHTQNLGGSLTNTNQIAGVGVIGLANTSATTSTGGSQPHNNIQPSITLNYIIKY